MAFSAIAGLLLAFVSMMAAPSAAGAVDGDQITETLEGCRASAAAYPPGGPFVCADAQYTTGNLGPGWNEFDLVPHRLTLQRSSNSSTGTYSLNVVADNLESGVPGYDFISELTVNDASHASCQVTSGPLQTTSGIGGTDTSIYRTITVTQDPGTTCVFDYYERLAIGSSGFPGSSLHSNLTNEDFTVGGVGARDVSIPVREILPQRIDKTMSASQGSDHIWNITKSSTPANLNFADTCSAATGARSATVAVTVTWTKLPATPSGDVTVITTVTATNVAQRPIGVSVTDVIRSGTTVLDTVTFPTVIVPANTTTTIGTHTLVVPAAQAVDLNDIATATYSDPVAGHPPITFTRTATASATVQQTGTPENATAVITDVESITGTGLSFSVDSTSGAAGTFAGGYVLGTSTTGPVSWTSATQSDSGSVTFNKTVRVDQPRQTSGTLTDTASLSGSNGFATSAGPLNIGITASATTTLSITKTIPNILQGAETAQFVIDVLDSTRTTVLATRTFTFAAGQTSLTQSVSLPPGVYDVVERPATGWSPQPAVDDVDLTLPTCARTVTFNNTFGPASARAVKTTVPAGNEAGWQLCLLGPGTPAAPGECVVTDASGAAPFTTVLQEGTYTVTETPRAGFDQTSPANGAACSFTVDFPADAGRVFTCSFTNTERGTVTVIKTSSGQVPAAGAFTFEIRTGASVNALGTVVDTDTNDATGLVDFDGANPLAPGAYQLCETNMLPGWHSSLSDQAGAFVPGSALPDPDNSVVCVPFTLDPGEDEAFAVANTPPPGGDARTIGFWRNWTSCDGRGNQDPVLDETLVAAGGSILIGDLTVDTCAEAVQIVSKRSLDGTNRANDAAYGLAAQLLAARLNVAAGAETCSALTSALAAAQALLDDVGFTGTGDHLGPRVRGARLAQRNQALSLAATLDAYNNNLLC